ncbi:topology modulation protein [Bacillus sp. 2205SS5-2]|uniref:topology modulation protein n=1 Tax=Bacillus sp. 2205SS5-2 TaxID=3109031 RepID=UPI003007D8A1
MKKILVMGISAGVGKSTFARKLAEKINIDVYHLDTMYWKSGWKEASLEEFSTKQKEIVEKDVWIIEGNYRSTNHIRIPHADTIIYLELPLYLCLFRVIKRYFTNIGQNRPDMGDGCTEKLDWAFLKFIYTTYHPRKEKMEELFQKFLEGDPKRRVIKLTTRKEIRQYSPEIKQ